jgi:DNA-binding FrmR family transcriptional regulator
MPDQPLHDDITRRLRRIEGQVRGLQKMMDEGRECEEMLTQSMAVRSAIDQVGARLMEYHLNRCLLADFECRDDQMDALRRALALWIRFGQPAPAMALPYEAEN